MIVDIEQAREKICHKAMNKPYGQRELCVADHCMAWRKTGQIGINPNGKRVDINMDGRVRWVDQGYCGLAGKP